MKKLISAFLGIVLTSLLIWTFTKKNTQQNIDNSHTNIKNSQIEQNHPIYKKEKNSTSIEKIVHLKNRKIDNRLSTLKYLNYRKERHQLEQQKIYRYLTHQKKLQHKKEGGVQSKLQKEKKRDNVRFQNRYISTMMSKRGEKHGSVIDEKRRRVERRELMQSLKNRQILQTKYRGEL